MRKMMGAPMLRVQGQGVAKHAKTKKNFCPVRLCEASRATGPPHDSSTFLYEISPEQPRPQRRKAFPALIMTPSQPLKPHSNDPQGPGFLADNELCPLHCIPAPTILCHPPIFEQRRPINLASDGHAEIGQDEWLFTTGFQPAQLVSEAYWPTGCRDRVGDGLWRRARRVISPGYSSRNHLHHQASY
jgi:hypothetical protein